MEKILECLNRAEECMACDDEKKLLELVKELCVDYNPEFMLEPVLNVKYGFRVIMTQIRDLVWTKPHFFENNELVSAVATFISKLHSPFNIMNAESRLEIYHSEILNAIRNRTPGRMESIRAILKIGHMDRDDMVMLDIIYAAMLYEDYELMKNIADEMADTSSVINGFIYADIPNNIMNQWVFVLISFLIKKERYDVLDRVVEVVYQNKNFDAKLVSCQLYGISWLEIVKALYNRYMPEVTEKQLGEIILNNSWLLSRGDSSFYYTGLRLTDSELYELAGSGAKVYVLNKILPMIPEFKNEDIEERFINFIDDEAVFYLNDTTWFCCNKEEIIEKIVNAKPNLTISIDNNEYFPTIPSRTSNHMFVSDQSMRQIIKDRKISFNGRIKDSTFFRALVKNNKKIIHTILARLDVTDEMLGELAELCVEYKNLDLLNRINKGYNKKKSRKQE